MAALLSFDAAWASGELDPSFGTGGLVVSTLSPAADVAHAVAIQPDGKIVVGGSGFGGELLLARYTADGALDPTFGIDGVVRGGIAGVAIDIVLPPDGSIVAAVAVGDATIITRYHSDGTLDDTFFYPYGHGRVYLTLTSGIDGQGGLVRQEENGWFVAGGAFAQGPRFALERVTDTGWPDSEFGAFFGFCEASVGTDGNAELWDVARLPEHKFVAVGSALSGGHTDFAVVRFDAYGCPDPSFGSNGGIVTPIVAGADERARAVVVEPDGRIVVLGDTGGSPSAFAVVRYRPDGSLDPTFGSGGIALVSVGVSDVARDLARSADGSFVVGGQADGLFTIVRLDATGHLDQRFGTGGVLQIVEPPFASCCSELRALALEPDGGVVAAGSSTVDLPSTGLDVALARLLAERCGNGVLDAGETCDDGNADAGDCCSPRCELDPAGTACGEDGLACTRDVCDGAGACVHPVGPPAGCRSSIVPGGVKLAMRNNASDQRDRLTWAWRHGAPIALDELGDPTTTTAYVLCGSVGSSLAFELDTPPGEICYGGPSWKARRTGFRYHCSAGGSTGVTHLLVTAGPSGTPRAVMKARGLKLPLPALPIGLPLRVQLLTDGGLCLDSVFSAPARNDANRFDARSSP
jgi:uncharacterized delta-60 repeat protein